MDYLPASSYLTSLDSGIVSSSTGAQVGFVSESGDSTWLVQYQVQNKLLKVGFIEITTLPSGLISGSSQLTSS